MPRGLPWTGAGDCHGGRKEKKTQLMEEKPWRNYGQSRRVLDFPLPDLVAMPKWGNDPQCMAICPKS